MHTIKASRESEAGEFSLNLLMRIPALCRLCPVWLRKYVYRTHPEITPQHTYSILPPDLATVVLTLLHTTAELVAQGLVKWHPPWRLETPQTAGSWRQAGSPGWLKASPQADWLPCVLTDCTINMLFGDSKMPIQTASTHVYLAWIL